MIKLAPKSVEVDQPLSPKMVSFLSSTTQQDKKAELRNSIISSTLTENKVPLMINASKNLFGVINKDFK